MRKTLATAAGALFFGLVAAGNAAACDLHTGDAAKAGAGCAQAWMDRNLRMNDILTVGTHNSYKQAISPPVMALLKAAAPKAATDLDYHHGPLAEQLDDGARALELDLAYDPVGGRFARPAALKLTGQTPPEAYVAAMSRPGLKVLHVQDVDFGSSCLAFVDCLTIIRAWSLAHPRHTPILITMNTNDEKARLPGGVDELPFDTAAYDAVDREIASVFPLDALITPDRVRGRFGTVREAALKQGWPSLGAARGKVLFAVDEPPAHIAAYRGARRSLEGRLMFVNTDEASPASAYITLNETADLARIAADVKAGLLVRTRADADTVEARTNDTRRRDAALASGAQYVSTDYRHPDPRWSAYQVRLPGGAVTLCNPLRRPERCAGLPIEP
jgi:hypothetical protein